MAEIRGSYRATVTLLLEDVTADQAVEFWDRLASKDVEIEMSDGLVYEAEVVALIEEPAP